MQEVLNVVLTGGELVVWEYWSAGLPTFIDFNTDGSNLG